MKKLDLSMIRKDQARRLRAHGMSQGKVATMTGLTKGIVNNLTKNDIVDTEDKALEIRMEAGEACMFCGAPIDQPLGPGRRRRFCSEECRRKYWQLHRHDNGRRPGIHHIQVCAYCGKTFDVYGNARRKYCCHEHYLLHRNSNKLPDSAAEIAG